MAIISIIVAHNSEKFLDRFLPRHLSELGDEVCIVNSSASPLRINVDSVKVIETGSNVGYASGCNRGIEFGLSVGASHFIIINPDVYLPPSWLSRIKNTIFDDEYSCVGAFTAPLLGYNFKKDSPSGKVDSLGISHTWYGHWYDLSQGSPSELVDFAAKPYNIPASCGALMILTRDAVERLITGRGYVFNEAYFMYKEDIELSLHLQSLGKRIMIIPAAFAYHCRGWHPQRADTPFWARRLSARNEVRLDLKYYKQFLPYSLLKYFYVQTYERLTWF